MLREAFTDCDMFGINFPIDLDVKMKAVLLGACFLIVSPNAFRFMDRNNKVIYFRTSCFSKKLAMKSAIDQECFKHSGEVEQTMHFSIYLFVFPSVFPNFVDLHLNLPKNQEHPNLQP